MRLLGLSAYFHDSAAALIEDGAIVAAAQEERFTRIKHDASFPRHAAAFGLSRASGPIDAVVYYEKPLLKFERILTTAIATAPRGFRAFTAAMPTWLREKLWLRSVIADELTALGCRDTPVHFATHHQSHAASAFYPSPFESAAVLTLDGVGEWSCATLGRGHGGQLELLQELRFPHSPGLLYSAFTHHCGFRVNSGEYKLMGLAPYGKPRFASIIRDHFIDLRDDGSFRLNLDYFGFLRGQSMTTPRFAAKLGVPARPPEAPLLQVHCDLARSIQVVIEDIVLRLARTLHKLTGEKNLCLAGGVALNCVANACLLREGPFANLWVQPASGDAGGALGAALAFHYAQPDAQRTTVAFDDMRGAFLGPDFPDDDFRDALAAYQLFEYAQRPAAHELPPIIARRLSEGAVIGLFHGRAEFGPRALGARSILADPRRADMQRRLNLKIKGRESFRPFAPAVLVEKAATFFDLRAPSPYMLLTAPVAAAQRRDAPPASSWQAALATPRSTIPAVTHVDFSARVQTVDRRDNPHFHAILSAFDELTGCPVLVNTSFNVRGEPPVGSPRDAIEGFLATDMDALALGPFFLEKQSIPTVLRRPPQRHFAPD